MYLAVCHITPETRGIVTSVWSAHFNRRLGLLVYHSISAVCFPHLQPEAFMQMNLFSVTLFDHLKTVLLTSVVRIGCHAEFILVILFHV